MTTIYIHVLCPSMYGTNKYQKLDSFQFKATTCHGELLLSIKITV